MITIVLQYKSTDTSNHNHIKNFVLDLWSQTHLCDAAGVSGNNWPIGSMLQVEDSHDTITQTRRGLNLGKNKAYRNAWKWMKQWTRDDTTFVFEFETHNVKNARTCRFCQRMLLKWWRTTPVMDTENNDKTSPLFFLSTSVASIGLSSTDPLAGRMPPFNMASWWKETKRQTEWTMIDQ